MSDKKIAEQAKAIMDDFIKVLSKVESPKEFGFNKKENTRDGKPISWEGFKERMLDNAPKVKDDCIVGEKKHW